MISFEEMSKKLGTTVQIVESITVHGIADEVIEGVIVDPNVECQALVSLLIDMSGSMGCVTEQVREALTTLPQLLQSAYIYQKNPDCVLIQVIYFTHETIVGLPWTTLRDMGSVFDPNTYYPTGGTMLYNAMRDQIIGIQTQINSADSRHIDTTIATIILTDGATDEQPVINASTIRSQLESWQMQHGVKYYSCYLASGQGAYNTGIGLGYTPDKNLILLPESHTYEFGKKVREAIHMASTHALIKTSSATTI